MSNVKELILKEAKLFRDDVTMDEALLAIYRRCLLEERVNAARDSDVRYTTDEVRAKLKQWITE